MTKLITLQQAIEIGRRPLSPAEYQDMLNAPTGEQRAEAIHKDMRELGEWYEEYRVGIGQNETECPK